MSPSPTNCGPLPEFFFGTQLKVIHLVTSVVDKTFVITTTHVIFDLSLILCNFNLN